MPSFTDVTFAKIGEASNNCEDITNVKRFGFQPLVGGGQRHQPSTVMNTVSANGWQRGHKHVQIEIHTRAYNYHAFYHNGSGNKAYIIGDSNSPDVPYFVVKVKNDLGKEVTFTFTGVIVDMPTYNVNDGQETVNIYRLSASVVTPSDEVTIT